MAQGMTDGQFTPEEAGLLSPLTLAYVGDAVYELVVRTMLVRTANQPVHQLHAKASRLVKAEKQSEISGILEPLLEEDEKRIWRRGRNAKANTHSRSAGILDYRRATGFEALMGYLYLSGRTGRMLELIAAGLQIGREELEMPRIDRGISGKQMTAVPDGEMENAES